MERRTADPDRAAERRSADGTPAFWHRLYALVIALLAIEIVLLALVTQRFAP